jgi:glycosyltransferase involved in cell wall biosynthesis
MEFQKFSIIYSPTIDYSFMVQRPQNLAKALAGLGHEVFYLNLNQQNLPPEQVEPNLTVIHNHEDIFKIEKKYPTVLWMSWAKTHDWIERLKPDISFYDCIDDFKDWYEFEKTIVQKVDLVTCTADILYDKMITMHENVVMARNACEYEHFATTPYLRTPSDWKSVRYRKVIGYVGALAPWVDRELIIKLSKLYTVALVGGNFGSDFSGLPNVFQYGLKHYSVLPSYLKNMDVLIIPFLLNDITNATNPVKLFEYLATGKPIVSTGLPEVKKYPVAYIGETHDEFLERVAFSLTPQANTPQLIEARKQVAQQNSWKARAEVITEALTKTWNKKK